MILLTGATGFVGSRVAAALRADGRPVRCLVRSRERGEPLERIGCELVDGDVTNADSLRRAVAGCDAVVHLVAIIAGKPDDFERIMTRGTADLTAAANAAGVTRFVLMSALGTGGATTIPYYRAKQAMEDGVIASGIPAVTLRPSFVFGPSGGALARFVQIVRRSPVIPVLGPGTQRIQPVWVEDVAACVSRAVETPPDGGTFEVGGPDVVTWNELWLRIARSLGKRRPLIHVPFGLARLPAAALERLPHPPLTRDQLAMLEMGDNVCDPAPAAQAFGVDLVPLDEQLRRTIAP
jgi:NADH dehydrogenase